MDQVQNSILQVMQAVTAAAQGAGKAGSGKDDFRKLMDSQRRPDSGAQTETNPKAEAAQDGEPQEIPEGDPQLQERIMLAAAMLQAPVAVQVQEPVEVTEVQPELEAAPVDLTAGKAPEAEVQTAREEILPESAPETAVQTAETVQEAPGTREVQEAPAVQEADRETVETVETAQTREEQSSDGDERKETDQDAGTPVFQDLKAVPVKVGEAETTERTQEAKPVETQIGEKLAEALKSGETRVEIQLTPENLGKVTIEVTLHEDGSLRVNLHAELSQTRDLLTRDLSTLQSALARNTQQDVRVEVQRQQEERNFYDGQQGQERQNPHQQRREDRRSRESAEDFLHQLRLGLIPEEGE